MPWRTASVKTAAWEQGSLCSSRRHLLEQTSFWLRRSNLVSVLRISGRFVYYLVTKKKYNQKPTYDSLRKSLVSMREHCLANGVNSISMPRIGCGLDKLKWENVSSIIHRSLPGHKNIHHCVHNLDHSWSETHIIS